MLRACFLRWKRADRPRSSTISFSWNVFATVRLAPGRCAVTTAANDSGSQRDTGLCPAHDRHPPATRSSPWSNFWTSPLLSDIRLWVPAQSLHAPAIARPLVIRYCNPHAIRWRQFLRRVDTRPHYDEQHWRRTQSGDRGRRTRSACADCLNAVGRRNAVRPAAAQSAAGIQVEVSFFRRLGDHMRSQEVQSLDEAVMDGFRDSRSRTLGRHFVTACPSSCAQIRKPSDHSDVWDLVVFGFTGFLRFDRHLADLAAGSGQSTRRTTTFPAAGGKARKGPVPNHESTSWPCSRRVCVCNVDDSGADLSCTGTKRHRPHS